MQTKLCLESLFRRREIEGSKHPVMMSTEALYSLISAEIPIVIHSFQRWDFRCSTSMSIMSLGRSIKTIAMVRKSVRREWGKKEEWRGGGGGGYVVILIMEINDICYFEGYEMVRSTERKRN